MTINLKKINILKMKERKMYYNSNDKNNDYYSAYKEEMSNSSKAPNNTFTQILKLGLIILFLGLLAMGALYLFNYFVTGTQANSSTVSSNKIAQTNTNQSKKDSLSSEKISEDKRTQSMKQQELTAQAIAQIKQDAIQPKATQNRSNNDSIKKSISSVTGSSNINPKDIELIVKIIMSQMKQAPQKKIATDTTINLEKQLATAEKQVMPKQTLKESNHYNKVVVSSNEALSNTSNNELTQLQNSMNDTLKENNESNEDSDYSKAISKEVTVRSNEMRVIIVQKGDTLSKIAKKAYGNYDDYIKIFKANPEVVKNPDEIYVGQRLRIPS